MDENFLQSHVLGVPLVQEALASFQQLGEPPRHGLFRVNHQHARGNIRRRELLLLDDAPPRPTQAWVYA